MTVPLAPHATPSLCPEALLSAGCGPRGHTPKSENSDPAQFQKFLYTWASLGPIGWTLAGAGWICNPRVLEVGTFTKKMHCMTQSSAKAMSDFTKRLPWLRAAVAVLWSLGVAILYLDVDVAYCNRHKLYRIFVHQEFPQEL